MKNSHSWTGGEEANERWYAIGKISRRQNSLDVKDENLHPWKYCGLDTIGVIEANQVTEINQNYKNNAEPVYVRILPVHGKTGPLIVYGLLVVEYFSTLEWLLNLNRNDIHRWFRRFNTRHFTVSSF